MAFDDTHWEDEYRRGCESSRKGREKRNREELEALRRLYPNNNSYMVQTKGGLWDVYKNGVYFDTFDTKGQAWKALYEG